MKFKMAATAGLSLTLDPIGKMFQNASSLKPLGQLKPNCPGMIIVFYSDRRSKMAATAGHRLTLDPMGKYSNAFFSETTKEPSNDHSYAIWFELSQWFQRRSILKHFSNRVQC
jgi:hypothetical protein